MNGYEHTIGGVVGGPLIGAALAATAKRQPTFAEFCGWVGGGVVGAKLPDLFEPAYCPHHRKFCHSGCAFVLNVAAIQSEAMQNAINALTNKAKTYHLMAASDSANAQSYKLYGYVLEFIAGLLPGLMGGYTSHLTWIRRQHSDYRSFDRNRKPSKENIDNGFRQTHSNIPRNVSQGTCRLVGEEPEEGIPRIRAHSWQYQTWDAERKIWR